MNQLKTNIKLNKNGDRRGMHPNTQKNIKLAKPKGRPKKEHSITNIQRQMLGQPCPYKAGVTWAEYLAERGLALAGEKAQYYCELMDRLEGKVAQPISGTGEPIVITGKITIVGDRED